MKLEGNSISERKEFKYLVCAGIKYFWHNTFMNYKFRNYGYQTLIFRDRPSERRQELLLLKKILIVDDEVHLVKILEFTLQHAGYEVISCGNGTDAVEKVVSERPDLVILDLMLPGLDGYEVCRRIKNDHELRGIPVIMLSARDYREEGLEHSLPADAFMRKPFNTDNLIKTIERLTGGDSSC